jgi:hypothetical protein
MNALRPYLKAVVPFVLTIIAVCAQWFVTGEFDKAEFATALTGALSALVTYAVSNEPGDIQRDPPELVEERDIHEVA